MHIGQCGLQLGFALWELLIAEHGIDRDGTPSGSFEDNNNSYQSFFNLSNAGQYVPRGLFVDLEPNVIDQMRKGSYSDLFHPDQMISGQEDAASNFARGFHTVGRIMKLPCESRIRKEFEISDRIQAIHIYRSLGGGTGSGMTATLFEILLEYAKISKIEIPIHPSPHISCSVVEPYNCILSEHFCMDDVDVSFLIDNEALYDIASNKLQLKDPTTHNINRIVAQVCSSLTASSRFPNELFNDFINLTNLIPYPRIHFPLVSYSPLGSQSKINKSQNTISEITFALFENSNQLVKCDPSTGKYMSCSLVYRGNISLTEIFNSLAEIKSNNHISFVDWCPTGFKVGIVNQPPQVIMNSFLGESDKNVIMMTNTSSVSCIWHRLAQKFHKLYAKRSFVHWFVAEGLEESEFCESLYNLATLAKDYEEVAMDTKVSDVKIETSTNGEGGEGSPVGEAGQKKTEKGNEEGKEEEANEEDNDDENENASNFFKANENISNCNMYNKWINDFEALINSFGKINENSLNETSNIKSKLFYEKNKYSQVSKEIKTNMQPFIKNNDCESMNANVKPKSEEKTPGNCIQDLKTIYDMNKSNSEFNINEPLRNFNNNRASKEFSGTSPHDLDVTTSFLIEDLIRLNSSK